MRTGVATLALLGSLVFFADRAEARTELVPLSTHSPDYTVPSWCLARGGHHGRPEVIRAIQIVAHVWKHAHPSGYTISVNDISLRSGGPYIVGGKQRHKTHRDGKDADIQTFPNQICDTDFGNVNLQVELATLFRRYGATRILFNGRALQARLGFVDPCPGHDNHFHVDFDAVDRIPEDVTAQDRARGVTPLFGKVGESAFEATRPDLIDRARRGITSAVTAITGYRSESEPDAKNGAAAGPNGDGNGNGSTPSEKGAPEGELGEEGQLYMVVPGDSLSKIAARYGMTWRQLYSYDGGTGQSNSARLDAQTRGVRGRISGDEDFIYPGEAILVPSAARRPR